MWPRMIPAPVVRPSVAVAPADAIAGDQPPDLADLRDACLREPTEVVTPVVDVRLEVARPPPEPRRDLRQDAPGEVLVPLETSVPRGEHRGVQALRVAVRVPSEGSHVVGGGHAKAASTAVRRLTDHQHTAEERQLVLGQGHRSAAKALANLLQRSRLDDATGSAAAHEIARPCGCERADQLLHRLVRMDRADDPGKQLAAGTNAVHGCRDDQRDASFDKHPDQRRQLGINDAAGNQANE